MYLCWPILILAFSFVPWDAPLTIISKHSKAVLGMMLDRYYFHGLFVPPCLFNNIETWCKLYKAIGDSLPHLQAPQLKKTKTNQQTWEAWRWVYRYVHVHELTSSPCTHTCMYIPVAETVTDCHTILAPFVLIMHQGHAPAITYT